MLSGILFHRFSHSINCERKSNNIKQEKNQEYRQQLLHVEPIEDLDLSRHRLHMSEDYTSKLTKAEKTLTKEVQKPN